MESIAQRKDISTLNPCRIFPCLLFPLHLCWDKFCLPKVGFFTLFVLHQKALPIERLKKFGILGPSRCSLCEEEEESVDHIFLHCPYSSSWWKWLYSILGIQLEFPKSIKEMLSSWPLLRSDSIYHCLWISFASIEK